MRRKRDESQMGISIKRKDPEQEQLWMAEREQAWRRWEPYWKERTRDLGRVMDYPLPGSLPVGEEDFLLLESCTGTFSLQSQQSNLLYGVLRVRQGIDQRQADSRSAAWMCYLSDLEYLEQQGLDVRALMP